MSLAELRRETAVARAAGNVRRAEESAWFFHIRFSLAAAAVAVSGFLLTMSITGTLARIMVTLFVCLVYWALLYTGEWLAVTRALVPAFAGAWLPNVFFAALAIARRGSTTRRRSSSETSHQSSNRRTDTEHSSSPSTSTITSIG